MDFFRDFIPLEEECINLSHSFHVDACHGFVAMSPVDSSSLSIYELSFLNTNLLIVCQLNLDECIIAFKIFMHEGHPHIFICTPTQLLTYNVSTDSNLIFKIILTDRVSTISDVFNCVETDQMEILLGCENGKLFSVKFSYNFRSHVSTNVELLNIFPENEPIHTIESLETFPKTSSELFECSCCKCPTGRASPILSSSGFVSASPARAYGCFSTKNLFESNKDDTVQIPPTNNSTPPNTTLRTVAIGSRANNVRGVLISPSTKQVIIGRQKARAWVAEAPSGTVAITMKLGTASTMLPLTEGAEVWSNTSGEFSQSAWTTFPSREKTEGGGGGGGGDNDEDANMFEPSLMHIKCFNKSFLATWGSERCGWSLMSAPPLVGLRETPAFISYVSALVPSGIEQVDQEERDWELVGSAWDESCACGIQILKKGKNVVLSRLFLFEPGDILKTTNINILAAARKESKLTQRNNSAVENTSSSTYNFLTNPFLAAALVENVLAFRNAIFKAPPIPVDFNEKQFDVVDVQTSISANKKLNISSQPLLTAPHHSLAVESPNFTCSASQLFDFIDSLADGIQSRVNIACKLLASDAQLVLDVLRSLIPFLIVSSKGQGTSASNMLHQGAGVAERAAARLRPFLFACEFAASRSRVVTEVRGSFPPTRVDYAPDSNIDSIPTLSQTTSSSVNNSKTLSKQQQNPTQVNQMKTISSLQLVCSEGEIISLEAHKDIIMKTRGTSGAFMEMSMIASAEELFATGGLLASNEADAAIIMEGKGSETSDSDEQLDLSFSGGIGTVVVKFSNWTEILGILLKHATSSASSNETNEINLIRRCARLNNSFVGEVTNDVKLFMSAIVCVSDACEQFCDFKEDNVLTLLLVLCIRLLSPPLVTRHELLHTNDEEGIQSQLTEDIQFFGSIQKQAEAILATVQDNSDSSCMSPPMSWQQFGHLPPRTPLCVTLDIQACQPRLIKCAVSNLHVPLISCAVVRLLMQTTSSSTLPPSITSGWIHACNQVSQWNVLRLFFEETRQSVLRSQSGVPTYTDVVNCIPLWWSLLLYLSVSGIHSVEHPSIACAHHRIRSQVAKYNDDLSAKIDIQMERQVKEGRKRLADLLGKYGLNCVSELIHPSSAVLKTYLPVGLFLPPLLWDGDVNLKNENLMSMADLRGLAVGVSSRIKTRLAAFLEARYEYLNNRNNPDVNNVEFDENEKEFTKKAYTLIVG